MLLSACRRLKASGAARTAQQSAVIRPRVQANTVIEKAVLGVVPVRRHSKVQCSVVWLEGQQVL